MQKRRRSGQGIVYSGVDVKNWVQRLPSATAVRPACCSGCGAASYPHGKAVVLVGHGTRERQVRGPCWPGEPPGILVVRIRRYLCRRCGAITTVLPQGLVERRYYSSSAIGLALLLYGVRREPMQQVREAVCAWSVTFESPQQWNTPGKWLKAVSEQRMYSQVRPWPPSYVPRQRAERVASTLLSFAPVVSEPALTLEEQVFVGAALAA
jgi:hypothetical protein